jgi:hypothetical protein
VRFGQCGGSEAVEQPLEAQNKMALVIGSAQSNFVRLAARKLVIPELHSALYGG